MEALQQSVVKLACDAGALADPRIQSSIELPCHVAKTELMGHPQHRDNSSPEQHPEPVRLVIRWCYIEIQSGRVIIPDTITITCNHAKRIISRRQIRVERL